MSYCRFGWDGSDVYVFESCYGGFECCGCILKDKGFNCETPDEMIKHLCEHRRAGHFVPPDAVLALFEDVPGAQRPSRPEPATMTKAMIGLAIAELQLRLKDYEETSKTDMEKLMNPKEQNEKDKIDG